tara:strand:- start:2681 stop:4351 length:1671 start_codon:yes stop_codon:yes gene_type:complete
MKQLYFILIFLMSFMLTSQENIFFSEYAEGSSNNKYLEIYNNSDQTVDLTQYAFPNVSNDPTTVGEYEYWNTFDAGATIEPFGIYVIANPSADGAILAEADMTFTYLSNGDDGFKLVYGTEDSFTVVDELGDWQGDPGSGWDVAGVSGGTANHTLVRKSSVQNGSSWSVSAGTTAEDSEWIVYDQDTWTYLGSHEIETTQDECPIPVITTWSMTGDGVNFDGTNQDGVTGYQIEYSTSTFTPGDGTATVYEFDAFPHTMTGLQPSTTYYFTIRSICGDNYSEWEQNPNNNGDGPDAYTTTTCPSSYSLPYLNDFNDPVAWTSCQTFNDNDGDGNFWFYQAFDADTADLSANSASYINGVGPLTPDNWVIMGPIDLTNHTDALLEWEVRGFDANWCNENYSVYVGSSNNYSDLLGSSVSYTETISGDACGSWANRSLDISAATGDLVYIGLRHHGVTDMYILNIDNVSVTSSTMSNEDFTLDNIEYTFNQDTNILRITSTEVLSNIQIYNMLGQEVLNNKLNQTSESVDLSDLSSAVYIVNIEGNNSRTKNFKLVVK